MGEAKKRRAAGQPGRTQKYREITAWVTADVAALIEEARVQYAARAALPLDRVDTTAFHAALIEAGAKYVIGMSKATEQAERLVKTPDELLVAK